MLGFLLLCAIAFAMWWRGQPFWRIVGVLTLVWALIALAIYTLPQAASLVGTSLAVWYGLGGAAVLALAYAALIGFLRRRAIEPEPATETQPPVQQGLSEAELDRYARHLVLREIGGPGQMRLHQARVLVVGAGGLGAPVCLYLASAGVGQITLADDDTVSLSNLQRQVIFRMDQIGQPKAEAAAAALAQLNPHVKVTPLLRRIGPDDTALIAEHDLVIDGTDSFASRTDVNRACVAAGVPLLAGAIAQWEGQVTLYDPARGGPCLHCLFPTAPALGTVPSCAEAGVVGALPGVIGSVLALEAIKHLTGAGQGLRGRMMLFDGLYGENRMVLTEKRPDCALCGSALEGPGKAS